MALSPVQMPNRLVVREAIASDVRRLDQCAEWFHVGVVASELSQLREASPHGAAGEALVPLVEKPAPEGKLSSAMMWPAATAAGVRAAPGASIADGILACLFDGLECARF